MESEVRNQWRLPYLQTELTRQIAIYEYRLMLKAEGGKA